MVWRGFFCAHSLVAPGWRVVARSNGPTKPPAGWRDPRVSEAWSLKCSASMLNPLSEGPSVKGHGCWQPKAQVQVTAGAKTAVSSEFTCVARAGFSRL